MTHPSQQREFALQIVQQLRDAGYQALWAGGCVRDQLLGRVPEDYDVATDARPEQVRELFGKRRTLAIGAAFGVIGVLGRRAQPPIEVATFRSDGAYVDGRRPQGIVYTTAEEDAQRRDFTINGMFFDPLDDQVIDYVDGQRDLRQGVVRAIGDPSARFAEDKLRMLRAVRFATTLRFQIDPPTFAAIQAMASQATVVSAERIGAELRRLFVHAERSRGVQLLSEAGLLQSLVPELAALADKNDPRWQRTHQHLQRLESESLPVALAALLVELADVELVGAVGHRFRFTNKEIDRAKWLVRQLPLVLQALQLPWPRLQRLLVHEGANDLLALADAVAGRDHPGVLQCRRRLALPTEQLNPPPLLSGQDLIAHGLQPGPYFTPLLNHLRDAQLEGRLSDREQALAEADRWMRAHKNAR